MVQDHQVRPTVRVPHPLMSLWQSSVNQVIANRESGGNLAASAVRSHPYAVAVDGLAAAHHSHHTQPAIAPAPASAEQAELGHALSTVMMQIHRNNVDLKTAVESVRRFSNQDPEFKVECVTQFVEFYLRSWEPLYRSWEEQQEGLAFGVIKYRLPNDARVAIIGDWGTGMDDAAEMLTALLVKAKPLILIHLGDIYYSGTRQEVSANFLQIIDRCCKEAGLRDRLPVFNLPGNHDYYSGGVGFFEAIDLLNGGDQRQAASYFCLRTEDDRFQFVGLDTGRRDHVPGLPYAPWYRAPDLDSREVEWAQDKIKAFHGETILLTHHQAFSACQSLNGLFSFTGFPRYINHSLLDALGPYLPNIAMWFWGHEHSLALFEDGFMGIRKGRLLGCSAFESPTGDGYAPRFREVRYEEPAVKLGIQNQWLNHGCAVIDMGQGVVEYYQFPSSGGPGMPNSELSLLAREQILGDRL